MTNVGTWNAISLRSNIVYPVQIPKDSYVHNICRLKATKSGELLAIVDLLLYIVVVTIVSLGTNVESQRFVARLPRQLDQTRYVGGLGSASVCACSCVASQSPPCD